MLDIIKDHQYIVDLMLDLWSMVLYFFFFDTIAFDVILTVTGRQKTY